MYLCGMMTGLAFTILFPLLSFVLQLSFGKKIKYRDTLAVIFMALAFVSALSVALPVWRSDVPLQFAYHWAKIAGLNNTSSLFTLSFGVDKLAAAMLLLVTGIATLVHIFSIAYMRGEPYLHRYWGYLGLFCAAMLGIIIAKSLLLMFMCWELVGVSSYLLIGFWFQKDKPAFAAQKAFLINRMGDVGFLSGILLLFAYTHTFDLGEIAHQLHTGALGEALSHGTYLYNLPLTIIGVLLFCGAIGKSAQVPLQIWLPDAMEGPTPVSSLIHAATMVAAGVYLTARIYFLLTPEARIIIAFIGALTAFTAAITAITQMDIKRVLAYSTISQLGYMMVGMGASAYSFSLFHLFTHAFFKCALFLVSAIVIHEIAHQTEKLGTPQQADFSPQSMRFMGGLRKQMPKTFYGYMVSMLALSGVPFFSGFLSKEGILVAVYNAAYTQGPLMKTAAILAFLTAGITAFYMTRHALLIFGGKNRLHFAFPGIHPHFHDPEWKMWVPVAILGIGALFLPFSLHPFSGEESWIVHNFEAPAGIFSRIPLLPFDTHCIVTLLSLGLAGTGMLLGFLCFHEPKKNEQPASALSLGSKIYNRWIVVPVMWISGRLASWETIMTGDRQNKGWVHQLSEKHFFWERMLDTSVARPFLWLSQTLTWWDAKVIDGGVNFIGSAVVNNFQHGISLSNVSSGFDAHIIDRIVNTIATWVKKIGEGIRAMQTGKLQQYLLISFVGLLLLVGGFFLYKRMGKTVPTTLPTAETQYEVIQTVIRQDTFQAAFPFTVMHNTLVNDLERLATDPSMYQQINTQLGNDSLTLADFHFFGLQYQNLKDVVLVADSFPQMKLYSDKQIDSLAGSQSGIATDTAATLVRPYYYELSLPMFTADKQKAILSLRLKCGNLCGKGYKIILKKSEKGWILLKKVDIWLS